MQRLKKMQTPKYRYLEKTHVTPRVRRVDLTARRCSRVTLVPLFTSVYICAYIYIHLYIHIYT